MKLVKELGEPVCQNTGQCYHRCRIKFITVSTTVHREYHSCSTMASSSICGLCTINPDRLCVIHSNCVGLIICQSRSYVSVLGITTETDWKTSRIGDHRHKSRVKAAIFHTTGTSEGTLSDSVIFGVAIWDILQRSSQRFH